MDQAVSELTRIPASGNLVEANKTATERLLEGTVVDGVVDWEGGKSRPVHYIDWQNPENNLFTVVNQFRVDVPSNDGHPIIPDVALFVNGIPLVVLEAKKPQTSSLKNAADRLLRYSEQIQGEVRMGNQLSETMELSGETVDVAKSGGRARAILGRHGPGLVFVMIQKQRDGSSSGPGMSVDTALGEANADESIVVLVDEAHRSHTASLGTNLQIALPNAARIGFTGTPIMSKKGQRKTTLELFGEFIDMYRLKEAEEDGVIVPILYEGLNVRGAVQDGRDLDEIVDEMLDELPPEDREQLQRRYATKANVSAAEKLIAAKAKHMLRHYIDRVLPEGFKAQVVAGTRRTTVQYREALMAARDELVAEAESLPGWVLAKPLDELKPRQSFLVSAHRHLDLLKRMQFVPVISQGDTEHEAEFAEWTDKAKQRTRVAEFLKPYDESDIGFVIVNAMLLTGFDAPIEQVMYLDRKLQEHELLQAVARVNRTADGKKYGYVVDYQGVAQNLVEALKVYAHQSYDEDDFADVEEALKNVKEEIDKLEPRRNRVRMMFRDPDDVESCVEELADAELRDRFNADFALFAKTYNAVLPDPAVKPFEADLKRFTVVKITAVGGTGWTAASSTRPRTADASGT